MCAEPFSPFRPKAQARSHSREPRSRRGPAEDGFLCKHCRTYVSSAIWLSGVGNRNHCPYCLWSRHLDLYEAGDRLAACKAPMQPIGLTVKATHKKYGPGRGELMLIHACTDCGRLSLNRIAADDDPQKLWAVFEASFGGTDPRLAGRSIDLLIEADRETVRLQLFGTTVD